MPIDNYHKNKNTYDGYAYYCKDCVRVKQDVSRKREVLLIELPITNHRNKDLVQYSNKQLVKELEARGILMKGIRITKIKKSKPCSKKEMS